MKRLLMKKLWLLPFLTAVLTAASISGKWAGNIEVEDNSSGAIINTQVRAEFQQQQDAVSGTIGRQEDQELQSIRNAKLLDGKQLTFEVSPAETGGVIKFVLTLEGDHLEGQMSGDLDAGSVTGKVHLSRAPVHDTQ
jgi:hypothetical protein